MFFWCVYFVFWTFLPAYTAVYVQCGFVQESRARTLLMPPCVPLVFWLRLWLYTRPLGRRGSLSFGLSTNNSSTLFDVGNILQVCRPTGLCATSSVPPFVCTSATSPNPRRPPVLATLRPLLFVPALDSLFCEPCFDGGLWGGGWQACTTRTAVSWDVLLKPRPRRCMFCVRAEVLRLILYTYTLHPPWSVLRPLCIFAGNYFERKTRLSTYMFRACLR